MAPLRFFIRLCAVGAVFAAFSFPLPAAAQTQPVYAPYNELYMTYSYIPPYIQWVTCGKTRTNSGCFNANLFGPFNHICAILGKEGRYVYIVDTNVPVAGMPKGEVKIYIWQQVWGNGADSYNMQVHTISLPIAADPNATCKIAATKNTIFFGTNTSPPFIIDRVTFAVRQASELGPDPVTSISVTNTAALQFGVMSNANGFAVYDDKGVLQDYEKEVGPWAPTFLPGDIPFYP